MEKLAGRTTDVLVELTEPEPNSNSTGAAEGKLDGDCWGWWDAGLRGRDAVNVDHDGPIVGVLKCESMRPPDAVESLLPLELLGEHWEQSWPSQSSQPEARMSLCVLR